VAEAALNGEELIGTRGIEKCLEKIPMKCTDENVDLDRLGKYFTIAGWQALLCIVRQCKVCDGDIDSDSGLSLGCDVCLCLIFLNIIYFTFNNNNKHKLLLCQYHQKEPSSVVHLVKGLGKVHVQCKIYQQMIKWSGKV